MLDKKTYTERLESDNFERCLINSIQAIAFELYILNDTLDNIHSKE